MKTRLFFTFVLLIVGGYLIAGQAIRVIQSGFWGNGWVNRRYAAAMNAFPSIHGRAVFFMGASEVEEGVRPKLFNEEVRRSGLDVTSYNLGFRNISPRNLGDLVRQMSYSRAPDLKVDAVYLKYSPSDLTLESQAATEAVDDEVAANVFSVPYLLSHLSVSNLGLLAIKELQGGFVNTNLNSRFRAHVLYAMGQLTGQNLLLWGPLDLPRYYLWADPRYNAAPEWNPAHGGFHDRSADLKSAGADAEMNGIYDQQSESEHLKFNFLMQEQRAGATSLRMSPKMVAEFKAQLQALRGLTDHVVLFYFPDHPLLERSAEASARARGLVDEVCLNPWLRCLRFDLAQTFAPGDYYDTFHLRPKAVARLTRLLASDFKKTMAAR